ncbi:MAG: translesion error-prone DNA polymerase V subunit UmuC [Gammaproteobacteria bacterium]|nr:translesion error-prone DNA polymerase V subunit UmuC [Gammaproteobacteria bacterium]
MYGLVDCNSFYASCEQIFRPELRGKPVVVLSNNDGFVVARSQEAKRLGIPDLEPFFKIEPLLRKHRVAIFSSNYPLYGNISDRVMTTLHEYSPHVELYSIDEMFLQMQGGGQALVREGQQIKERLWRDVRMPVGVGLAPTKTLAKLANKLAKTIPKLQGVCLLDEPHKWEWALRRVPPSAIWGVGKRLSARLDALGIESAWDLATADAKLVRRRSSVCLERTISELNGMPCLALDETPPAKQQIYCSRSFGKKATTVEPILNAISLYAARAAEKLRAQQFFALSMHVFAHTSPFEPGYHAFSDIVQLPYPTDDTRLITQAARQAVKRLFSDGHAYLKAGIGLVDIIDKRFYQQDLFHPGQSAKADATMRLIDRINGRMGKNTVYLAAQGVSRPWYMRQNFTSPGYTTNWNDLPVAQ